MAQVILDTIATAFNHLKDDVRVALHTQLGDSAQLDQRIQACSRLLVHTNQVCLAYFFFIFTKHEMAFCIDSIQILYRLHSIRQYKTAYII